MAPKTRSKHGLGRGLDALFADQVKTTEEPAVKETAGPDAVQYIDINDIKPNGEQPRKKFNEERIAELADSIRIHGIIQPLVVRQKGRIFEIVAGERRWRAARQAELRKVPCLVREFTDEENILVAMIENLQREDLDAIEEAMGFRMMHDAYGMTQKQISASVSKSRPYITNSLRLLKLPEEVQARVSDGSLSSGHARALVAAGSEAQQIALCERIIAEGLSVRETEKLVQNQGKVRKAPQRKKRKDANVKEAEQRLKAYFGTKAVIEQRGTKGEIRLTYYDGDDLNRLLDLLLSGAR